VVSLATTSSAANVNKDQFAICRDFKVFLRFSKPSSSDAEAAVNLVKDILLYEGDANICRLNGLNDDVAPITLLENKDFTDELSSIPLSSDVRLFLTVGPRLSPPQCIFRQGNTVMPSCGGSALASITLEYEIQRELSAKALIFQHFPHL
jgi:hypothetical protein